MGGTGTRASFTVPRRGAPSRIGLPARGGGMAGAIAARLREDIVAMALAPGTPLRDAALCERFGTSRTPVREALIRLGEEGLVEILPQSGTFVSRIPVAAIPEAVTCAASPCSRSASADSRAACVGFE